VLDAGARVVRPSSRVVDDAAPTLVVIGDRAPDPGLPSHVDVGRVPLRDDGRIILPALLEVLAARGVGTLLVEGGPTIAASFLEAGLVDEVVGYVRAAILGGGRSLVDLPGVSTIDDLLTFRLVAADVVGDDVRMRMRVARRRSAASQPAEERSRA